ncbi:MAG: Gfo/Idh/MocA family oxidoreductase, partial [Kiritimatiellaeota bacterium]|nr:Gfo/Idh/MocA family oxidoreductase [Kiritimatiellota bacterium]
TEKKFSRRDFLKVSGATATFLAAAPAVIPGKVFGAEAPSKQITFGFVGTGNMGSSNIDRVLRLKDQGARAIAVCDVDKIFRERAAKHINKVYGDTSCKLVSGDFRELTRNPGIDAIVVSTPDHWHALIALDALRHGKDVYCEKPLTHSIREGQALVAALRQHNRVGQTGTMQRSDGSFRYVAEVIQKGALGKLDHIDILIPANNKYVGASWVPEAVPDGLDYDFWIGPAPFALYTKQRTHYQFRYIMDYAGGQTTNWGAHYIDIAQWALGMDQSGPVAVDGAGEFPTTGLFTAPTRVDFTATYASGVKLRVKTRTDGIYDGNVKFFGEKGWIDVSRSKLKASDEALLTIGGGPVKEKIAGGDPSGIGHMTNFIACIRSRERCVSDFAIGHRTTTICNLGNIVMQLRRPLKWDPVKEEFIGDQQANRLKERAYRAPWVLV